MRRLWIAAAILTTVFSATLLNSGYLSRFTAELNALLAQAETRVGDGDWETAVQLTQEAMDRWHAHNPYLYSVLRHSDTDAVHIGLREVRAFALHRDEGEYSAANAELMTQIELLSEMERFSLQNLL